MKEPMRVATGWIEQGLVPDAVIRRGIRRLCEQRLVDISTRDCDLAAAGLIQRRPEPFPPARTPQDSAPAVRLRSRGVRR